MFTAKELREALATMPDDAVVHLCVTGLPYLPIANPPKEALGGFLTDGGPGVVLVEPNQKCLVEELGIDGPIRKLLEEIRDNYEPELIAYDCAMEALELLDGASARLRP